MPGRSGSSGHAGAAGSRPSVPGTDGPRPAGGASRGREARRPLVGGRRVADLVTAIALLTITTAVAVAAGWGIVFLSLAFHSCSAPGNRCDVTLGGLVVYAGPVVVALVVVLAVLFAVVRMARRRLAWPIALAGLVAVVAVFSAALLLMGSAVTHGI